MMKENILPIAVQLLAFAHLTICSPFVTESDIDVTSEREYISEEPENELLLEIYKDFGNCLLYKEIKGSFGWFELTNQTKEELTQEGLKYYVVCLEYRPDFLQPSNATMFNSTMWSLIG